MRVRRSRPWRPWAPRTVSVDAPDLGRADGLAWARFLPDSAPLGSIVILHGAGSAKESHYDFARNALRAGFAAVAFDARGHGESEGALDDRAVEDVRAMAGLLPDAPLALRGSSMGGYLAIVCADAADADAVIAICPAPAEGMLRALRNQRYDFRADAERLEAFIQAHDDMDAARELRAKLLLMHAEGDESVPVEHSRELHAAVPGSKLIAVPGGHHRSIQHDGELQGEALRWLAKALAR